MSAVVLSVLGLLFFLWFVTAEYSSAPDAMQNASITNTSVYKPVLIIHGVLDPKANLQVLMKTIREEHPGTIVEFIDLYGGLTCFAPLWEQVEKFRQAVEEFSEKHPNGINLIGISQGSIIGRGVIETSEKHNVKIFVSVAGPQLGQYGLSSLSRWPLYKSLSKYVYKLFYSHLFGWFSIAELWRDPRQLDVYQKENVFLPYINNEIEHDKSQIFKENFLKIERLVLIGGPDDGLITPWQSSHFGFYDNNFTIVPMKEQEIYLKDSFGLRTLNERNSISIETVPNVKHQHFELDLNVIRNNILPYLT